MYNGLKSGTGILVVKAGVGAADFDIVVAPGANKALIVTGLSIICDTANAGDSLTIRDDGVPKVLGKISGAALEEYHFPHISGEDQAMTAGTNKKIEGVVGGTTARYTVYLRYVIVDA